MKFGEPFEATGNIVIVVTARLGVGFWETLRSDGFTVIIYFIGEYSVSKVVVMVGVRIKWGRVVLGGFK